MHAEDERTRLDVRAPASALPRETSKNAAYRYVADGHVVDDPPDGRQVGRDERPLAVSALRSGTTTTGVFPGAGSWSPKQGCRPRAKPGR